MINHPETRPLRIGIVCYPTFGGSGVVATELGKGLAAKGHKIHFITYNQPPRLDVLNENVFFHEVRFEHYPLFEYPPYETALASKMVDVVKHEKLDLLHVHYAIPHASAAYMARQILETQGIRIPIITTLHGTDITLVGKDPGFEPVVSFSINQSDGVTAVSADLARETMETFHISRHIEVIPNFIDLSRFRKQAREHFRLAICPAGERLLVHTSNFRKVKRIGDVLQMFSLLRKNMPAKLLLVGDGPERQKLEIMSRDLHLEQDVRFLGKLDAVEELLSVCDLFVMPSEKESFGLAALEAMACEVPVIASNAGGLPELIENGKNGFMSQVGDTEDMAKNAEFILQADHLPAFKTAALNRARQFDLHTILPRYEDFYREICFQSRSISA